MCFQALGVVGSVIGAVVSAAGAQAQADSQAQAAEYNAKVARNNATSAAYAGTHEAQVVGEKGRKTLGQQGPAYAAAGVRLGTGTPTTVYGESFAAVQGDIDAATYKGKVEAGRWQDQAKLYDLEAANARKAGQIAATSAIVSGFSGLGKAFSGGLGSPVTLLGTS